MSNSRRLSRRALLRGAGGVAIGLPFLNLMRAGRSIAAAQPAPLPKRFLVFFSPNGFSLPGWPLSTNLTGTILEPLAPHIDDVIVTRGLSMESAYADPVGDASHYNGWAHLLTGDYSLDGGNPRGGNISVDMFLANRIGADTRFRYSLQSVQETMPMSWLAAGSAASPDPRPDAVFDRLFADYDASADELVRVRERRRSILDYAAGSVQRMHCQLGREDQQRLELHLDSLRDVESRIGTSVSTCELPGRPGSSLAPPEAGRAQIDLISLAFACDLTRVGSVQYFRCVSGGTPTWAGVSEDHHELSHDGTESGQDKIRTINRWYAGEFAYLLERLKSMPEGDGTVLDSTCIVWVSELGLNTNEHTRRDLGIVIAGGGGGTLRGGQYLQFDNTPHQNLWVELINALSSEHGEVSTFGNPATCTGGLSEIRT